MTPKGGGVTMSPPRGPTANTGGARERLRTGRRDSPGPPSVRSRVRGRQVERAARVVGWNAEVPALCDRSRTLVVGLSARGARGRQGRASCARWRPRAVRVGSRPRHPPCAARWGRQRNGPRGLWFRQVLASRCHFPGVPAARWRAGATPPGCQLLAGLARWQKCPTGEGGAHPRRAAQRTHAPLISRLAWGRTVCVWAWLGVRDGIAAASAMSHLDPHATEEVGGPPPRSGWQKSYVDGEAMSHLERGAARPRQRRSPSSGVELKSATVRKYSMCACF